MKSRHAKKSLMSAIVIVLAMSFAGRLAHAENLKIGFVNLQKALESVDAGKRAKAKLEKDAAAKRLSLEKEQERLKKEVEALEKKAAIMSDRAKAQKRAELQQKFMEFQKKMGSSQMELQQMERQLTQPIINELKSIVQALGKEKKLQLILEKSESAVLYAQGGEDLTQTVIKRFNKANKRKKKRKG